MNKAQAVSLITKAIIAASSAWAAKHGFSQTDWTNLVAEAIALGAGVFAHWYHSTPTKP